MNFISKWKDKITDFAEAKVEQVKLNIIEQVSSIGSFLLYAIMLLLMLLMVFILLGFSLAEYFGNLFDSYALGYLITAGVYFIFALILVAARKSITTAFGDIFVRILTKNAGEDDNDDDDK
jgi:polyferredoxin